MKSKRIVFLDTNVFIYAFEFPKSNSKKIADLLNDDKILVYVSEMVLEEVTRYFKKYYDKDLASHFREYILDSCEVVQKEDIVDSMDFYSGKIKDKDLEQITAVKVLGIKYLIAYDRDFLPFEEYITPKKFIELIGLIAAETEF